MKPTAILWRALFVALVLLSTTLSATAADIPIVGGTLWTKSSDGEKTSYLVGLSNMLDVEYVYQTKSKKPPSDEQSIIRRLYEEVDEVTLDEAIARIDAWYAANPKRLDRSVLDVIWTEFSKK